MARWKVLCFGRIREEMCFVRVMFERIRVQVESLQQMLSIRKRIGRFCEKKSLGNWRICGRGKASDAMHTQSRLPSHTCEIHRRGREKLTRVCSSLSFQDLHCRLEDIPIGQLPALQSLYVLDSVENDADYVGSCKGIDCMVHFRRG